MERCQNSRSPVIHHTFTFSLFVSRMISHTVWNWTLMCWHQNCCARGVKAHFLVQVQLTLAIPSKHSSWVHSFDPHIIHPLFQNTSANLRPGPYLDGKKAAHPRPRVSACCLPFWLFRGEQGTRRQDLKSLNQTVVVVVELLSCVCDILLYSTGLCIQYLIISVWHRELYSVSYSWKESASLCCTLENNTVVYQLLLKKRRKKKEKAQKLFGFGLMGENDVPRPQHFSLHPAKLLWYNSETLTSAPSLSGALPWSSRVIIIYIEF